MPQAFAVSGGPHMNLGIMPVMANQLKSPHDGDVCNGMACAKCLVRLLPFNA